MMDCPAEGCTRKRKVEDLLCPPCWFSLPRDLRADVYRYWRAWKKQPGNDIWWREHQRARSAALYWLSQHPATAPAKTRGQRAAQR